MSMWRALDASRAPQQAPPFPSCSASSWDASSWPWLSTWRSSEIQRHGICGGASGHWPLPSASWQSPNSCAAICRSMPYSHAFPLFCGSEVGPRTEVLEQSVGKNETLGRAAHDFERRLEAHRQIRQASEPPSFFAEGGAAFTIQGRGISFFHHQAFPHSQLLLAIAFRSSVHERTLLPIVYLCCASVRGYP